MASTMIKSILPLTRLALDSSKTSKPVINKILSANAWVGSYRVKNPSEYLDRYPKPTRWPRKNELVQPIQVDVKDGEKRPATYHHYRENIKYSPKKMWHVTKFIRGMNINEAVKQLKFIPYKGAQIAAEVLIEAQEIAVKDHNFEFRSNMWIEDAICNKGLMIKGLRKHARMRFGTVNHFYCHLLIKLTEGDPPVHFYKPKKDGNDLLKDYYDELRSRKIPQGL